MAANATSPIIPAFLVSWVQLLVSDKCFDEFFIEFNFLHVPCLKAVISKGLGYGIILGALVVKMPQVMKIWKAQSGQGISITSIVFEMVAFCTTVVYSYRKGFPFSSYGEGLFMIVQTALIGAMVLHFSNKNLQALIFVMFFALSSGFLVSPIAPFSCLALLQTGNIFVVIVAKMMQAVSNFRNGNTGQLSVITVFMLMFGSTARIFTSIQETGDALIIAGFLVATFFNVIIALQMVYYWNVPLVKILSEQNIGGMKSSIRPFMVEDQLSTTTTPQSTYMADPKAALPTLSDTSAERGRGHVELRQRAIQSTASNPTLSVTDKNVGTSEV